MFRNYLKSAFRFLKRNKLFAGINALGLSTALAASFIILLFVINELSYNTCHKNRNRVFRVLNYYTEFKTTQTGTPYVLASALKEAFPQVEKAVNINPVQLKLKEGEEFIQIYQALASGSEIFDMFTFSFLHGGQKPGLINEQNSIVLSREIAGKLFGEENPVGKEVEGKINNKDQVFVVTGVFDDLPVNSTFKAKCFVNSKWSIEPINKAFNTNNADVSWNYDIWRTWVMLSENCNVSELENQFRAFEKKNLGEKPIKNFSLQKLSDVYLGSDHVQNTGIKGNLSNIRLFLAIAILIILVAAFNFIILSTAVSTGRVKEIGIRKTSGAGIQSIRTQLLNESILLSVSVLPFALVLAWLAMPYAGKLMQTRLEIIAANIPVYLLVYLTLTMLIGIASGFYTSFYLSRLSVIDVLKNTIRMGKSKSVFRSAMIVTQLVIFCAFVSGTLIIQSQYRYALSKDLGHYKNDIILVDVEDCKSYSAYLNSIRSNPYIISAAGVMEGVPMLGSMSAMYEHFQDKTQKVKVEGMATDYQFLKTLGILIIDGRDFSEEFGSDMMQSVILNETAVKKLGITDPVGKKIDGKNIIGIAKDFNLHSIHSDIPPMMITLTDRYIRQVAVHYKSGTLERLLPVLESDWKKTESGAPFSYMNIEDLIQNLYSSEKNLSTIVSISALFTLLIAAIGLFGLTLYLVRTQTKEIGIKKVFGISEHVIIGTFLKKNFVLVVISSVLSVPITWYFMNKWLNGFAYHTTISWWVFAVAFAVATSVVLLTVLYHSWRASRINPVEALKYE